MEKSNQFYKWQTEVSWSRATYLTLTCGRHYDIKKKDLVVSRVSRAFWKTSWRKRSPSSDLDEWMRSLPCTMERRVSLSEVTVFKAKWWCERRGRTEELGRSGSDHEKLKCDSEEPGVWTSRADGRCEPGLTWFSLSCTHDREVSQIQWI